MEKNIMLMAHENNVLDNSLNITLINENKMEVKIVKNTQMKRACKTNDTKYTKSCIEIQNADITSSKYDIENGKKNTYSSLLGNFSV